MPYIKSADWMRMQQIARAKDGKITDLTEQNIEFQKEIGKLRSDLESKRPTTVVRVDVFADLKDAIARDAKDIDANTIANALLNRICIGLNAREDAFIMEKGESVKAQPFRLTDSTYKVVSRSMLERIVKETKVDDIQWEAEEYDCDDIARKFVGRCVELGINSVGRVMSWSGGHAFNIAVVQNQNDVEFLFIEPQTDEFIEVLEGKYSLSNALIIMS